MGCTIAPGFGSKSLVFFVASDLALGVGRCYQLRERSYVSVTFPELTSNIPDTQDRPLGDKVSDGEYEQLLRQTGVVEGEQGSQVSAFNSSI
jgi:hypothetical protein